jgi:TonB family protein
MKYPSDAVRNNITGSVLIGYTVDKDGSISDVIVKKSVYPALDDEAIRVVKSSPRWIPATERGVPVRVKYTIPIKFSMSR